MPITSLPADTKNIREEVLDHLRAIRVGEETGHVSHGFFWEPGVDYGDCLWEALVIPRGQNQTGYGVPGAGYGGAHNMLLGFNSGSTHCRVTGNVWNGTSTVEFVSPQIIRLGDPVHVAATYDGTNILVWVNGWCEGATPYTGTRSTPAAADSILYVGQSNHSGFDMDVLWVRGFEGGVPIPTGTKVPWRPQMWPNAVYHDGTDYANASFLAYYTEARRIVPDLSNGLWSDALSAFVKHPGVREGQIGSTGSFTDVNLVNSPEDEWPSFVPATIEKPDHDISTAPSGTLAYDYFDRHSSPLWDTTIALGSTEGGSLGPLAWSNQAAYGTSYGRAKPVNSSDVITTVDLNSQNVRADWQGLVGGYGDFYHKYVDADNYIMVQCLGAAKNLYVRVGGSTSTPWSTGSGADAASVTIETSGTALEVWINGVSVYSGTPSMPTGDKYGFSMVSGRLASLDGVEFRSA